MACLLASYLTACDVSARTEAYDQLIVRAREGETEPALMMLRQMAHDGDLEARFDHVVIASWANKPDEVIAVYEALPQEQTTRPPNVQLAAARAYRDRKRWEEALELLRSGLYPHPSPGHETGFAAGYVMTLADAGHFEDALLHARHWAGRLPESADLYLALAYVHTRQQRPFDALYYTDKALQLTPDTRWAQQEYVFALQRVGLAIPALETAKHYPGLMTPAQMRALEADVLARKTRIAAMPSRNEGERFMVADRALARYDELIQAWQGMGDETRQDLVRIRIDRLGALHARSRMHDLVREYEALHQEGVSIPAWALSDVASAYLYLRQPEKARDLYRQVLAAFDRPNAAGKPTEPVDSEDRLNNETGLFYALAEAEQFAQIAPILTRLESAHAPWRWLTGQPERVPNDHHLNVRQTIATAHLMANDTPAAQQQLEGMLASAPNNANLHAELAGVYRTRGWPRRAEQQLKLAETLAPRALPVITGQGFTALDLQEWQQAEELSADAVGRRPELLPAQRLARMWQVHNKAELHVRGNRGLASDSPVTGSGEISLDSTVYSAPIRYNLRFFSGIGHAHGRYAEGVGYHNWQTAGFEWRRRDLWLETEISNHRYAKTTRVGARLSATYDLGDRLQLGAHLESFSRQTPQRALASGIYAHTLEAWLLWRDSERREWRFGLTPMHFADNNQRWGLHVAASERLYTRPHLMLDLLFEASAQHNNRDDQRPYFNPRRDLMLLPGLRVSQILHRRYESIWEQLASVSAGSYSQHGQGTDAAFGLSYGQRYRRNDVLDISGLINATSRPYDGRRERELRVLFDLNYRF